MKRNQGLPRAGSRRRDLLHFSASSFQRSSLSSFQFSREAHFPASSSQIPVLQRSSGTGMNTHCPNVAGPIRRNLARFVWPGWGCFPATSVRVLLLLLCLPFPKGILWAPLGFPLKTRNLDSNFSSPAARCVGGVTPLHLDPATFGQWV